MGALEPNIFQSKKTIEKKRGCGIGRSYYMYEDDEGAVEPTSVTERNRRRSGRTRRETDKNVCKQLSTRGKRSRLNSVKMTLAVLTRGLSLTGRNERTARHGEKFTRHREESEHGGKNKEKIESAEALYHDSYVEFMSGSSPKS